MTRFIILFFCLLTTKVIISQSIYVRYRDLTDKSYTYILIKNDSMFKVDAFGLIYRWDILSRNKIVASDNNRLGIIDINEKAMKYVYSTKEAILDVACSENMVFFTTAPFEDMRFEVSSLYSLDITNLKTKKMNLHDSINITNIATNGEYIAFSHKSSSKYYLMIYNLKSDNIEIIDSADINHGEYFTQVDQGRLFRFENCKLYYYKKGNSLGKIKVYNFLTKKNTIVRSYPEKYITSFDVHNGSFYFNNSGRAIYKDSLQNTLINTKTMNKGYINDIFYIK